MPHFPLSKTFWAGSPMWGSIPGPQDPVVSQRQMLNQLSHPGTPRPQNGLVLTESRFKLNFYFLKPRIFWQTYDIRQLLLLEKNEQCINLLPYIGNLISSQKAVIRFMFCFLLFSPWLTTKYSTDLKIQYRLIILAAYTPFNFLSPAKVTSC